MIYITSRSWVQLEACGCAFFWNLPIYEAPSSYYTAYESLQQECCSGSTNYI